jgi:rhomboid family GlyGly-CTERM serine protease
LDALSHGRLAEFRDALAARHALAFIGIALALAVPVGVAALGFPVRELLRYERSAVSAGAGWRILTAHLVHYYFRHLALNLAGLALLWGLFLGDAPARAWLAVALVSAVTICAGLWFLDPGLSWYLGLSGVLHGLWAAAGVAACRRWRLEGLVTLALLAGKLVFEQSYGALTAGGRDSLPVVTEAHLYGALGGLTAALVMRLFRPSL